MRVNPPMPLPVQRALAKLGDDIRTARLRRRIPTTLMAERAMITRATLSKVEKGNAGVSLGIYATVLFLLGMTSRLSELADVKNDAVGLQLDEERLPKRITRTRKINSNLRSSGTQPAHLNGASPRFARPKGSNINEP